jgi:predicted RNase H-like HicB family nuclease
MAAEESKARRFVIAVCDGAYDIVIEKKAAREYIIVVPDIPGCTAQADSFDAALAMARETIEHCIRDLRNAGRPVPRPGTLQ